MNNPPLSGKTIVLGVSGGIAAYKSVELVRILTSKGAVVRVIMTKNALEFVGPATFAALTGQPVYTDMWARQTNMSIRHISWATEADVVVVAPATANTVGKFANGIADDPLSTFMLAVTAPVLICPSMNLRMFENQIVQQNLKKLSKAGFCVMAPGQGFLACGDVGPGRLPEPHQIADRLEKLLSPKDLVGKNVLVTAGPTREPLDPVRFISNPSTGKMGYAIARAAEHRGARVVLISGPVDIDVPKNVEIIRVITALDMASAVHKNVESADIIIKTAAVSDYRPKKKADQKIKKTSRGMTLDLVPNPDILMQLGKQKKNRVLIGFAAETQKLAANAKQKLEKKNLDMIAANLIGPKDSGFGADTNKITCFYKSGESETLDIMSKNLAAHAILDRAVSFLADR